jgi:hypothetical protein
MLLDQIRAISDNFARIENFEPLSSNDSPLKQSRQ